jgi:hypothetical protein
MREGPESDVCLKQSCVSADARLQKSVAIQAMTMVSIYSITLILGGGDNPPPTGGFLQLQSHNNKKMYQSATFAYAGLSHKNLRGILPHCCPVPWDRGARTGECKLSRTGIQK